MESDDVLEAIDEMVRSVQDGPVEFRPGKFWSELLQANVEMIEAEGIENFKRTVSNNYFNWLVRSPRDPQFVWAVRRWLRHPSLAPLSARVEGSRDGFRTMQRKESFAISKSALRRYQFFVVQAWETARAEDRAGLTERLSEPLLGNPLAVKYGRQLVSQDLANSFLEWSFASGGKAEAVRVAELGAGYGRLAYVYAEASPVTYCIFDIPPALVVSQWYLSKVLGASRVVPFEREIDFATLERRLTPGTVAFFTPDQLTLFPDGWFDLTQTISTLPEMPAEQAHMYLSLLTAKSSRAVFLKQWRHWRNEADGTSLFEENYAPPPGWRVERRRVDPVQPAFFNQVWTREK